MAEYSTDAIALRGTPTGTEAAIVAAGLTVNELVIEASDQFRADVQPRYWPFTGVGEGDYATPAFVQVCVGHLARHKILQILGRENEMELGDDPNSQNSLAQYMRMRDDLMANPPRSQIPEMVIVEEVMTTFGVSPLGENEYQLNPGGLELEGFEVIPESVKIVGKQLGSDFLVDYSTKDRAWLLRRRTSDIGDGDEVTYRISFLRRREVDRPTARFGIELRRA